MFVVEQKSMPWYYHVVALMSQKSVERSWTESALRLPTYYDLTNIFICIFLTVYCYTYSAYFSLQVYLQFFAVIGIKVLGFG